jgi:hypothetical protein
MAGDGSPADCRSTTVMYGGSVYVISFSQNYLPGPKNSLERRTTRFSTISAKNQGPNQNFDKVVKILFFDAPSLPNSPCTHAWLRCRIHCYSTEYSVVSTSTTFSTTSMCYGYQQVRCMAAVWHLRSAHQTRARVDTNWPNLVFVITFRKIVPRT